MTKYIIKTTDEYQARTALDGWRWKSAMQDLDNQLRSTIKHGDDEVAARWAEIWRDQLHVILSNEGLNFDE